MTVVTRFPPSPTGMMHIGTARTLLYNWLYARGRGGKVVFRIEDTDRERYDAKHVDALINGVKWLELDYDGDVVSQYERRERHAAVAHELLAAGKAYYCYCTPEELEEMREKAKAEGRPTFYDRRWRDSSATPPEGVKPVIRIKAPLDGEVTLHDQVQGDVTLKNEQLDDMIILRSDGTPVYMLAVVVDDHDMGVTHVIRGDDHLNNTFRQNMIYDGMGWAQPTYGHLPLILAPDGSKMSKRKGAASVEEYRDMGYLPEAMRNYLLRLGWSHGDDEIISDKQALEWFGLDHVVKSPARWDFDKLNHLNAHYIKLADNNRLAALIELHLKTPVTDAGRKRLMAMMDELKSRAVTLVQLAEESEFLFKTAPVDMNEAALKLLDDEGKKALSMLATHLDALDIFNAATIEETCRTLAKDIREGKLGKVMMPLRAALTGRDKSPSLFHAAEILGREETINRIRAAAGL
ncbi:MAG: glutamate--tRNA ligase [Micavibrio aeruginosavorus]|uniref:Glutamate--tRNA ligase n=1 Tax=Micavibrio aeruginosavorus TaxID=349221 RepID=A0A2W4ZRC1_9BACT|nr:MAG: glutamate--tRNA ligase [Micavibrio aeruginosavorus]